MGSKTDKAVHAVNMVAKVFTSVLWGIGAYACFASGAWWLGLVAIAYLAYLWIFSGRWLIY